jgi:hypothetical protein
VAIRTLADTTAANTDAAGLKRICGGMRTHSRRDSGCVVRCRTYVGVHAPMTCHQTGDAGHDSCQRRHVGRDQQATHPRSSAARQSSTACSRRSPPPRIPRLCDGLPVRLSQLRRFLTCANGHCNLSNRISTIEFVLLEMDGGNVRVFVSFDRGGIRTDPYLAKMASGQQERSPQGAVADLPAHFSEQGDNQ